MRITGGSLRGRKLPPFTWEGTKPSTDKVRQALFNIIRPNWDSLNNSILDCYAGTGLLSLEFISRGAGFVTSIDKNRKCIKYMESNQKLLGIDNWKINKEDVVRYIVNTEETYDLVFADPPYGDSDIEEYIVLVLERSNILTKKGIFVLEHSSRRVFDHKNRYQTKIYGETALSFYNG